MADRDLYRTVILLEVLHEGIIPSDMDLPDIVRETIHGDFSAKWTSNCVRVSETEMATYLTAQGSDPAFILGEDWNEQTYDNRTPEEGDSDE